MDPNKENIEYQKKLILSQLELVETQLEWAHCQKAEATDITQRKKFEQLIEVYSLEFSHYKSRLDQLNVDINKPK